ncbi:MAG: hypothetical protein HC895_06010 [Leptolyngbyaceae cyanobacterium SM1_3_5]|nr:hypothetical protein [Leptolyngbyaceae cyanobacterium SM1_3_5]
MGGDWDLEVATGEIEAGLTIDRVKVEAFKAVLPDLSDLNWTSATNGWGPVERDRANGEQGAGDGGILTLNGVTYARGLGVHANSEITYALNGSYSRFLSDVGINDSVGSNGSVVFQVWADGTRLFESGVMTGNSATRAVDVDLTGRQTLRLVVTDAGNGANYDHANWAGAQLVADTTPPTADTTPPSATLAAASLNTSLANPYTFTIAYADASFVNVATLNSGDVRITGANNFSQLAQFVGVTPTANSSTVTATYRVTAADGIWNWNDNGTYTATLLAGEVQDAAGNAAAAAALGTFQVNVASTIVWEPTVLRWQKVEW